MTHKNNHQQHLQMFSQILNHDRAINCVSSLQ